MFRVSLEVGNASFEAWLETGNASFKKSVETQWWPLGLRGLSHLPEFCPAPPPSSGDVLKRIERGTQ
jgi:hypothetical protein